MKRPQYTHKSIVITISFNAESSHYRSPFVYFTLSRLF